MYPNVKAMTNHSKIGSKIRLFMVNTFLNLLIFTGGGATAAWCPKIEQEPCHLRTEANTPLRKADLTGFAQQKWTPCTCLAHLLAA